MNKQNKKSLREMGWLTRPIAEEFFLNNSKLVEKYKTYDLFIEDRYQYIKAAWNKNGGIGIIEAVEKKDNSHIDDSLDQEVINNELQSNYEVNPIINTKEIKIEHTPLSKSIESNDFSNIDIKILKSKKEKVYNNAPDFSTTCPYCFSALIKNDVGVFECSGDKLAIWEKDFLKYHSLSEEKKKEYLKTISYIDLFEELYQKWNFIDESGKRVNFTCEYSNKLFNPIAKIKTQMPDPCLVRIIEESLNRKLTEEEKAGEMEIFKEGKKYFADWKRGRTKVKIPILEFPDSF